MSRHPQSLPRYLLHALFSSVSLIWWLAAAGWLIGALVFVPAFLSDDRLSTFAKLGLAGYEGLTTFVLVAVAAGPAAVLAALAWRSRRPSLAARVTGVLLALSVTVLLAGLTASWLLYVFSGTFPGWSAIKMARSDPVQIVQHALHIVPGVTAQVTVAALVLAAAVAWLIRVILAHPLLMRWINNVTVVALFAAVALVLINTLTTPTMRAAPKSEAHRATTVGPASALAFSGLKEAFGRVTYRLSRLDEKALTRPPQTSMAQYMAEARQSKRRPWNVLVILVESLRWDELQPYGNELDVMPHVNDLAHQSVVFSSAYTQATTSVYADMVPLSSQYPLRTPHLSFYPDEIPYPRVMIYDVLERLGYRTAVISSQNENWGNMASFLQSGSLDKFLHSANYEGPTYVPSEDTSFKRWMSAFDQRSGKIDDRFTVAEAIDWIGTDQDEPFFAYMNLQNSHLPYEAPADFRAPFTEPAIMKRAEKIVASGIARGKTRQKLSKADIEAIHMRYRNALAYVDAQIGRLLAHLRETGQMDNTLILVTADTGQAIGEHGKIGHGMIPYEPIVRVPMFLYVPDEAPRTIHTTAEHLDVPPTILSTLGLPPHPSFQGSDLIHGHRDDTALVVSHSPFSDAYAIIQDRYKFVWDRLRNTRALYDLQEDPSEAHNIIAQKPGVARRLGATMDLWRRAQLEYYNNSLRQLREFPPQVRFSALLEKREGSTSEQ